MVKHSDKTSSFQFSPIGFLKSCYPDKFGVPRQSGLVTKTYSELKIRADLQPEQSLQGLEGYSHLWLQFVFHLNTAKRFHAKVHPPRLGGQSMGVFSTRSPHRPNPLGLSLVELVKIEGDTLYLSGADLVNGTPILDVKPYLPHLESKPQAKGGWCDDLDSSAIEVSFSDEAQRSLQAWIESSQRFELIEVIADILRQDPRPVVYRGYEDKPSPYRNQHAFRLYEGDIHFHFKSENQVEVFKIEVSS